MEAMNLRSSISYLAFGRFIVPKMNAKFMNFFSRFAVFVKSLRKLFGVKNINSESTRELIHAKDCKNHFQTKVDSGLIKVFRIRQGTDY